ncbi:hypothetical protein [Streptomyces sp. CC77]|uniref:hypothetical protein n=1 Tax=Streptomyces sp. CC77 TaxID=1906739 RepID=UPI0008DCBAA6|nr:hypothetical protein [Streptomyces sp. CC77]OII67469.1 hypothetical protein BJP39_01030 [Streptomyces sp. CC77]
MRLAVGDVVVHHRDAALGTVAGVAAAPAGSLVVVRLSGGALRLYEPDALSLVARGVPPMSRRRAAVRATGFVGALAAACFGVRVAYELGDRGLLVLLSGLGGYAAVRSACHALVRLIGPRRFRV